MKARGLAENLLCSNDKQSATSPLKALSVLYIPSTPNLPVISLSPSIRVISIATLFSLSSSTHYSASRIQLMWARALLTLFLLSLGLVVSTATAQSALVPREERPLLACMASYGHPNPQDCSQAIEHMQSSTGAFWWYPPKTPPNAVLECGHQWHKGTGPIISL